MKLTADKLTFSPADIIKYMESPYITWMDRWHLTDPEAPQPAEADDGMLILQARGIEHEQSFLNRLKDQGKEVFHTARGADSHASTLKAMRDGKEIIYQAALTKDNFAGIVDFLFKVPGESLLGDYHYEPWDTKLALKSKPYYLVQLCCYAEMLEATQGIRPSLIHIVLGSKEVKTFRTEDSYYYYLTLKRTFLTQQEAFDSKSPLLPSGTETNGQWDEHAQTYLTEIDHLSLIANITTSQIKKLEKAGITSLTQVARTDISYVPNLSSDTFVAIKEQAKIQLDSRGLDKPKYEVIVLPGENARKGLASLPPSSPMDIWFDMEGYPHVEGGLEYLFGASYYANGSLQFADWWAHNREQEKVAFEQFIDWAHARWQADPTMHIYHYAPYEVTAAKRLSTSFGTREQEVDDFLRHGVFIDLYAIVKQGLLIGEPKYSLKNVEHLYMDKRAGEVSKATDSIVYYQRWLETPDGADHQSSKILKDIRDYNQVDCDSTVALVDWLRERQLEHGIKFIPKVNAGTDTESQSRTPKQDSILAAEILAHIPADETFEDKRLRELLAYLVEFHTREAKPVWWAKFARLDMTDQELFDDFDCLANLVKSSRPSRPEKQSRIEHYLFDPSQDTKLTAQKTVHFVHDPRLRAEIFSINNELGEIELKLSKKHVETPRNLHLIPDEFVSAAVIQDSIFYQAQNWLHGNPLRNAISDFLARRRPNLKGNLSGPILDGLGDTTDQINRAILSMQNTTICIQGPPGTGKTFTAARAITALLKAGKTVGVSSNGHKAIANLVERAVEVARDQKVSCKAGRICSKPEQTTSAQARIDECESLDEALSSNYNLIGATAWQFSRKCCEDQVDYLFVDEAGQVSIANLLGMAISAKNIVLMGDQMQLSQPIKGSHPGESGMSCLDYLLQGKATIPDDFGIFLGLSYRMHPDVCKFISDSIYESRLQSHDDTRNRQLVIATGQEKSYLKTSGIAFCPVHHEGNTQQSTEEIEEIKKIISDLCQHAQLKTPQGILRSVSKADILIVAPYNLQIKALEREIPDVKIGTVDKFQGQEAPIVIVSMSASDASESARGMEFLLNKNRLNVAISRAMVLAIVVGNPALASARCMSVGQIELVNLFSKVLQSS